MKKLSTIVKNKKVLIFLALGIIIIAFVFVIPKINNKTEKPIQPPLSKEEDMEKIIQSLTAPDSSKEEYPQEVIESATAPKGGNINSEPDRPFSEEAIKSITAPEK